MGASVGERYELAFLGNIVHHFHRCGAMKLLEKVLSCLNPGGLILVWDIASRDTQTEVAAALFSLLFYINSASGCYSTGEVGKMLNSAGFVDVTEFQPPGPSTHVLIVGRKRGQIQSAPSSESGESE